MQKLKVYVGCALTHAPQEYKKMIEELKYELRMVPWILVLDFVTPNSMAQVADPLGIYHNDIHECVGVAHAIIADVTYPSTGLGWELGTCVEKHAIRTMLCIKKEAVLSNLPKGAPLHQENGHVSLDEYELSICELLTFFLEELHKLHTSLQLGNGLPS